MTSFPLCANNNNNSKEGNSLKNPLNGERFPCELLTRTSHCVQFPPGASLDSDWPESLC